jgi:hypothetical protein
MKTNHNIKDILDFKSTKIEANKSVLSDALNKELLKFDFDEDYLKEGNISIESCNEIKFHTSILENYTDTRELSEGIRPNISGVPMGKRQPSEFNVWDYKLVSNKEFKNDTQDLIIENSHHAIGCSTCKQHGKIRCSRCSGAGENTCSSCSGRGENQCSSCSGKGETRCWSCSGKGTTESGYGDNKRTQRCSSCSGRGYQMCSRCRNGYITCSPCSGRGKVTCYTCQGSGEVTCYECDGYRTMDHYFIVTADFENLSITQVLTNPSSGFDLVKAEDNNFDLKNKLFEITEKRFNKDLFDVVKSHPLYRQIISFFDFQDDKATRLIASKISFYENTYTEVVFTFYGEKYTLYFDKKLENAYYLGKKPSDQYELDLLNKALKSALNNDLEIAKKSIFKLSKYDFIKINEDFIFTAISDTESIYDAYSNIENKKYSSAESNLRLVSEDKKSDDDYIIVRKKLDIIYLKTTLLFSLVGISAICLKLFSKNSQFILSNLIVSACIIILCLLINRLIRNINFARWLVVALFSIQLGYLIYIDTSKENEIRAEYLKVEEFEKFKNGKIIISINNEDESLFNYQDFPRGLKGEAILLNEQNNGDDFNFYFVVKPGFVEKWYRSEVKLPNLVVKKQRRVYSDNDLEQILKSNPNPNDEIILRDWESNLEFYAKISDLYLIQNVAVEYMFNDIDGYEKKQIHVVDIPIYIYDLLKQNKPIDKYSFSNIPSKSIFEINFSSDTLNQIHNSLQIGSAYQGGIIVYIDETGEHGLIMSTDDIGDGTWSDAIELCSNYSQDAFDDWRLPTIEELRLVYSNKSYADNFPKNWYWSSTENPENSDQSYFLEFSSGNEMTLSKDYVKYVRAIRSF